MIEPHHVLVGGTACICRNSPRAAQVNVVPHGEYCVRIVGVDRKQHEISSAGRWEHFAGRDMPTPALSLQYQRSLLIYTEEAAVQARDAQTDPDRFTAWSRCGPPRGAHGAKTALTPAFY